MLEVILVCTVFALLITGIILAINRTFVFMNNTKVEIRATNLTREGMEMMFNIRDTNRRKYSGEKDKYWLYIGSGNDGQTSNYFGSGIYTIKEGINENGDRFVYAEKLNTINTPAEIQDFYKLEGFFKEDIPDYVQARSGSIVTFTGTYSYLSGNDTITGEIGELLGNGVEYYRIVRVYGIYRKDVSNSTTPANTDSGHYPEPKEMRFCVKTFYKLGVGVHASELCSIMTNFME